MTGFYTYVSSPGLSVTNLGLIGLVYVFVIRYVTNIFRIGNAKQNPDTRNNRAFVYEEIDLLRPEHVVLAGSRPRDIIGTIKHRIKSQYCACSILSGRNSEGNTAHSTNTVSKVRRTPL